MTMKTFVPYLTLLLITLLPAACKDKQSAVTETPTPAVETQASGLGGPTSADSLVFVLQRTPCFGHCKAYRIEVFRSGYATFNGAANVEKMGPHEGRVGMDTLRTLLDQAEEIRFFDMLDLYDADVTDLPSTIVRIVANGKDKQVKARVGTPARFRAFADQAEGLLFPVAWKPVPPKQ